MKIISVAALLVLPFTALLASPPPHGEATIQSAPVHDESSWLGGKYFFGDWGGLRDQLAEDGIIFDAYYVTDPAGNPVGGIDEGGFEYTDSWYLGMTVDLEKTVGWRDATFLVSVIDRNGGSLTQKNVGSIFVVQQVYGGQTFFLYNFALEQRFWDGKAAFKIGRFGASDDFNSSPVYGLYVNNGIDGDVRNVLLDTQFSSYPFATWGARLRIDPTPEYNAQFGIFQNWKDIFNPHNHGLNWGIRKEDGVFLITQIGWTPEFWKRPVTRGDSQPSDGKTQALTELRGLPGHYWIGGSLSTWNGYAQFGKTDKTRNSYGFYIHGDQMVYQEEPGSDQGLTLWAASGYYPQENISIMPLQINGGAFYTGLFPGRDADKAIVGVAWGRFSNDFSNQHEFLGQGRRTFEMMLEASYRIQLTKFAYIQPDVQYEVRPSGSRDIEDCLIVAAQVGVSF